MQAALKQAIRMRYHFAYQADSLDRPYCFPGI
jgi:hypothetical protein